MKIFFHILLLSIVFKTVSAQELPFHSQIFVNPYYYNPAYAGFEDRPAFYVYRRQQWTDIEGAPVTTGFNFHTIINEKVNFGLHFVNDKRSIFNTTKALITLGYRASFDDFHYVSFGLSGGIGFNRIDLDAIDSEDPAIADALDKNMFLDGNAGFNYFNNGFNLGLSLPKIFKNETLSNSSFAQGEISPLNDAIFMTSYKWEVTEDQFAIEPHIIYYYSAELPGQFEVIGLMHLMNVFTIGASYRQDYGVTGFVGININDNFKFGYGYEFYNVKSVEFSTGSHDIQLALVLGEKKKKKKISAMQQRRNTIRTQTKPPPAKTPPVEIAPVVVPVITETYNEEDALDDLLTEMEVEETIVEETFVEETTQVEEVEIAAPEEIKEDIIVPQFDDNGLYIGPTTVTKGNHLLELNASNYVTVGTFDNYRSAEEYSDALFIKGFYTKFGYISQTKIYYVYIYEHDDLQEALDTSERFNSIGAQFRENWVLQVK